MVHRATRRLSTTSRARVMTSTRTIHQRQVSQPRAAEHLWVIDGRRTVICGVVRMGPRPCRQTARWVGSQRYPMGERHHGCRVRSPATTRKDRPYVVSSVQRNCGQRTTSRKCARAARVHSLPHNLIPQCAHGAQANPLRTCRGRRHHHYRLHHGPLNIIPQVPLTSGAAARASRRATAARTTHPTAVHQ